MATKGQNVRLFIRGASAQGAPDTVVLSAKSLSLHISVTVETNTTKDTVVDWLSYEITEIHYEITSGALVNSGETITSTVGAKGLGFFEDSYDYDKLMKWEIANTDGLNNRTKGTVICNGQCIITNLQIQATNKQFATYQATLQGYGEIKVGATPT